MTFKNVNGHDGSSRLPTGVRFLRGSSLSPKDTFHLPRPLEHSRISLNPSPGQASPMQGPQWRPSFLPACVLAPCLGSCRSAFPISPRLPGYDAVGPHHFPLPAGHRLSSGAAPHCASPPLTVHTMVTHSFTASVASLLSPPNAIHLPLPNPCLQVHRSLL